MEGLTLAPLPIQKPRIPVWIGGESPPALRRAARWDGWALGNAEQRGSRWVPVKTPEQIGDIVLKLHTMRRDLGIDEGASFDIAVSGVSENGDSRLREDFEGAGVTWWLEGMFGMRGSVEELLKRIKHGP